MLQLSNELIGHICYFADIDTIKKFPKSLDLSFWKEYFLSRNVEITTYHDTHLHWIYEYNVNYIIKLLTQTPIFKCKICGDDTAGDNFCGIHLPHEKYIRIIYNISDQTKIRPFDCFIENKERTYKFLYNLYKKYNVLNWQLYDSK